MIELQRSVLQGQSSRSTGCLDAVSCTEVKCLPVKVYGNVVAVPRCEALGHGVCVSRHSENDCIPILGRSDCFVEGSV